MKTIIFLIPVGSFARLLLRSGVLDYVVRKAKVIIISPGAGDEKFVKEFSRKRVVIEKQITCHRPATLLEKIFHRIRNSKIIGSKKNRYIKLEKFENFILTRRKFYKIIKTLNPDLVVTASPGIVTMADLPYLRAARRLKIPTLGVINQWDNLSTKGLMPFRPDKLVLWNEASQKDAIELQYYNPDDLEICGVPHFDLYQKAPFEDRNLFFQKIGLTPEKPLVTFTTAPYKSVADHTYVLDILVNAIKNKSFSREIQILCRLHPLDNRERYKRFKNLKYIHFDYPGKYSPYLGWDPDINETKHLINTLYYTDVLVNIASTITIEAAILDKPIINLGFSSSEPERFYRKVLIEHHKRHYKYILEIGGIGIAKSEKELIGYINTYVENPKIDSEKRKQLAEALTYRVDGKSSQRVAEYILSLI